MKKVAFIIASMLVVMVSGCGGGTSSSVSDTQTVDNINSTEGVVDDVRGLTQFPAVPAVPES